MKIKTADLIGPALDWAVAQCKGFKKIRVMPAWSNKHGAHGGPQVMVSNEEDSSFDYRPSISWAQGGPIIEREWIELQNGSNLHPDLWGACKWSDTDAGIPLWEGRGPTPLIAAMRCYVASKLGGEVEVPDKLME